MNTGQHTGACVAVERKLGRNLLWLACLGVSTGPKILIFKHFRTIWANLMLPMQDTATSQVSQPLVNVSEDDVQFIKQQLEQHQPREDYLELLHLAARCVGIYTVAAIRRPGTIHRARWMGKAIYCLKMLLLYSGNEKIMKLTGRQLRGLQRLGRFVCLVYLKSWYTCRSAADASVTNQ